MSYSILSAMQLAPLDWGIIIAFFIVSLGIGVVASRSAGKSSSEFFLGGRSMPWWLLGVSMVATTFSTDTPNVVADFVRSHGVFKNWEWWAFLLSGMLTVFVFAKLWRRSEVMTDVELYEQRFSGRSAAFLRGFRALYLGLGFNVIIMGAVSLAAVKFGEIVLGVPGWQTLLVAGLITLVYSSLGGLKGVIWTDFVQFILAMVGSIWAMFHILGLGAVGGIQTLLSRPEVQGKTAMFPDFSEPSVWVPMILVPLTVTWWASYYPGAEPGGGGYIVQRMLAAKNEKNAVGATLFFNIAHYALRPWPWILIALASLVLVPMKINKDYTKGHLKPEPAAVKKVEDNYSQKAYDKMLELLSSKQKELVSNGKPTVEADRLLKLCRENPNSIEIKALSYIWHEKSFDKDKDKYKEPSKLADPLKEEGVVHMLLVNPDIALDKLGQDAGYPTMLKLLPTGLIGLVSASLIAAFMSTMSTQVNLGSSYLVNDFYARFINKNATDKQLVNGGRLVTVLMLSLGSALGLLLSDAGQAFRLILLIGAGTGLVYILRWFWWRVSALSEISAMVCSLGVSIFFTFILPEMNPTLASKMPGWQVLLIGTVVTTSVWIVVTFITKPTSKEVLYDFYKKVQPGGPGWKKVINDAEKDGVDLGNEENPQWDVPIGILCSLLGSVGVYTSLFATGYLVYGKTGYGIINVVIAVTSFLVLSRLWRKLKMS